MNRLNIALILAGSLSMYSTSSAAESKAMAESKNKGESVVSDTYVESNSKTSNSSLSGDYSFYGLITPVKVMREWSVSIDDAANISGYNLNDYREVTKAIDNGDLDGMFTHIVKYDFNKDGLTNNVQKRGANGPVTVCFYDLPGVFNVIYEDGKPVKFTIDDNQLQECFEAGMLLDAYDNGLEYFMLKYTPDGTVGSLSGKSMGFFGGNLYTETYSDYKFDTSGNWIRRKVTTPYYTSIQFRAYEY